MNQINLKAMAKINLGLDVVSKRADGYHEVRMIMQTVNLYDQIYIRKIKKPGIMVKTNLYYLPNNEKNLVYKAAKLLMDEFQIEQGIFIGLKKYIPVSAGMAGGSADAATTLHGINQMFQLGLTKRELMKRAVTLGADIPYCLLRGTALAEGIGEKLTRLPPLPKCRILIAKPNISVSTKYVYDNLRVNALKEHPNINGIIDGLKNEDLSQIAGSMGNVLETVTIRKYPIIENMKEHMRRNGALNALMSGSGPTVFGIFDDEAKARMAYEKMQRSRLAKQLYLTYSYNEEVERNERRFSN
jgi:4-diphosphocytidyl-2C-methyl-D-erythritol kinase